MSNERTRIANPIYDGAFKYLLDDNRIARLFLSAIIGEQIVSLTFRPTELRADLEQRSMTVFRMDFCASIALGEGREKLVILEIQKAKFATDIMRFRKYLGGQYASKENVYAAGGRHRALPIQSIYFLGHALNQLTDPVLRITRQYLDGSGKVITGPREEFVECLTHDSIVVQIPHLKERRQNDLESLLAIFDQSQKDPKDAHTLSIDEADYPEQFQPVIRRLVKAVSEPRVREIMEVEDDYLEDLEEMERTVAAMDAMIEQKNAELQQAKAEKAAVFEKAVQTLIAAGLSEAEARARLS